MKRLFREGSSGRHVLTLMTGTAIAQAIPVAISPVLTRLFTPRDMGLLALFMALSAIPAAVASGRYELAIQMAIDDDEALNAAALSTLIAVSFAVVLFAVAALSGDSIARLMGHDDIAPWLLLLPLSVLFSAFFTILTYLSSRGKRFRDVANANIIKSVAMGALQLGGGALKAGPASLIVGHVASLLAGNTRLIGNAIRGRTLRETVTRERMRQVAHRHSRLPKFVMFSTLANSLANNFGSVLVSGFYSVSTLGFYSIGQRVLGAPVQLIGNAIGQVFFQRASEAKNTTGTTYEVIRRARNALLICGLLIFVPLVFVIEPLLAFVFGEEWRPAGQYAQLLIPLIAARFVTSPIVLMNHINEQHIAHLVFNLALLTSTVAVILGCGRGGLAPSEMFLMLSLANAAVYIVHFLYIERTARHREGSVDRTIIEEQTTATGMGDVT